MASETSEHVIADFANSITNSNNTVTASTSFRWDKEQKVENLIRCLANYKHKDFNATKFSCMRRSKKEWLAYMNTNRHILGQSNYIVMFLQIIEL